jgi:tetratricopeptide (TPR) repeat protein
MTPGLSMDLDRWRRIATILDLTLELSTEERSACLDEICAGDAELRAEVEVLLTADAEAGAFLGVPAGELAPELLVEAAGEEENERVDLAGHQVGRYRLLREIGGGGMGTVYEAEDTQLGRRVAVKLLPPEYSRDRRAKERFLREARAAAAVDHPNLCTVHDAGESEGRLYIVLSFYEGETLRDRIRRGPLPLADAREVAIQVARGLARAHEAGIVHRDIKPANVMLPRRGEAKILDFGIARLEGDEVSLTRTGASWGTPAYMSPEHACGEPVDGRTDVWSLGVMLYEMVAGRRPFGGESIEALVSSILTQEPEPLERLRPDVPPELARVVDRALAKDPAERYENAAELLADLESGGAPGRRPSRRKALWVGLLAAALAALVLLVLVLWRRWQAPGPPLRVAVLQPIVKSEGKDPDLAFVAYDVVQSALASLASLDGVQLLDPPERNEGKEVEAERLREADEVLLPVLDCRKGSCQVTLQRRKPDNVVLAVSKSFEVEGGFENAYQLAEGVGAHVQQVYSDHRLRPESQSASVWPQDYATYIELQRRVDQGERLGKAELARLDSLTQTSRGLIGAYVLATSVARILGDTGRALECSERAERLAPYDPRPLLARLQAELEGHRLDRAPETLARFEKLAPGDARVKTAKADLLEARGELEEARILREEVAKRRPTWRNILTLATLELRLGASDSASKRLGDLLTAQPDNQYVWAEVADVETKYGDLHRAVALYEKMNRSHPALYLLRNLAGAYYLLGNYAAAAAADRRALALSPDDPWLRFHLAKTLEAQGSLTGAKQVYHSLANELAAAPHPLDMWHSLLEVQCLARLGQQAEATALADEVLRQRPEDVQFLHQAAQLYAILRKPNKAYYFMELALEKGLSRAWFTIPEFRSLDEEDPKFRLLLDRYTARKIAS